eukprot:Hpha_TRINITY_DN23443_c0_g1::TRINITY_DN23443_c0_g1_i1::g.113962::m.113962/K21278/DUSP1; dual specificity protein phosphatase 1
MSDLWSGRSELQEISPRVFLTNFFGAKNSDKLEAAGVTHVLVAAAELPFALEKKGRYTYHRLEVADNTHIPLPLADACDWIAAALEASESNRVVVHCAAGSSRSGSVATAWKMRAESIGLKEALKAVQSVRPIVLPNPGFMEQLEAFEQTLRPRAAGEAASG